MIFFFLYGHYPQIFFSKKKKNITLNSQQHLLLMCFSFVEVLFPPHCLQVQMSCLLESVDHGYFTWYFFLYLHHHRLFHSSVSISWLNSFFILGMQHLSYFVQMFVSLHVLKNHYFEFSGISSNSPHSYCRVNKCWKNYVALDFHVLFLWSFLVLFCTKI